ncbi:hypothetical protein BGX23_002372 [Mortierella sp. AD031]|nr:hypothetical protein BGX23_002372 [Mortierella sp. AD031]
MLFQPPLPDSDTEVAPSSHEAARHSWSHGRELYVPLGTTHTNSHSQRQGTYRAPSYSPSIDSFDDYRQNEQDDVDDLVAIAAEEKDEEQQEEQVRQLDEQEQERVDALIVEVKDRLVEERDRVDILIGEARDRLLEETRRLEEDSLNAQVQARQLQVKGREAQRLSDLTPAADSNAYDDDQSLAVPDGYTTRPEPLVHLEIHELGRPLQGGSSNLPRPRMFIFEPNTRLLLGRASSSGLDPKARLQQLSKAGEEKGQARAENGHDDGLFSNQVISKVHASISEREGQLVLEDLESTHGTYVNDEPIERQILHDLDHVRLGRPVTRKDIPYTALEFVVRIQSREHVEHLSTGGLADLVAVAAHKDNGELGDQGSLDYTAKAKGEMEQEDDEGGFDGGEQDDDQLEYTQIEPLEVQESMAWTPTDEQDAQEADNEQEAYDQDSYEQQQDDYEVDEDKQGTFNELENEYGVDEESEDDLNYGYSDFTQVPASHEEVIQAVIQRMENTKAQQEAVEYPPVLHANDPPLVYDLSNSEDDLAGDIPTASAVSDTVAVTPIAPIEDNYEPHAVGDTVTETTSSTTTTITTTMSAVSSVDAVEDNNSHLKRKRVEGEEPFLDHSNPLQEAPTTKSRKTALFAAALAGVVVGSVGTVLTLANI